MRSLTASTSSTWSNPSAASLPSTPATRSSGTEAPLVTPTVAASASHLSSISPVRLVEVGGTRARVLRDLDEADRVGGVRRADDDDHVGLARDDLDGGLPVLRGVADVVAWRVDQLREAFTQRRDRLHGLVNRQRGLGEPHHLGRVAHLDSGRALGAVDETDPIRVLSGGADDFLVALVADQQDVVVAGREAPGLVVHLGDERAGGVDGPQPAVFGRLPHLWRDAMRGEHDDAALGHLTRVLDEDGPAFLQLVHHVRVVHDLLAHVHGWTEPGECDLDGLHGTVDACAVASWLRQQDPAVRLRHAPMVGEGLRSPGHPVRVDWPTCITARNPVTPDRTELPRGLAEGMEILPQTRHNGLVCTG